MTTHFGKMTNRAAFWLICSSCIVPPCSATPIPDPQDPVGNLGFYFRIIRHPDCLEVNLKPTIAVRYWAQVNDYLLSEKDLANLVASPPYVDHMTWNDNLAMTFKLEDLRPLSDITTVKYNERRISCSSFNFVPRSKSEDGMMTGKFLLLQDVWAGPEKPTPGHEPFIAAVFYLNDTGFNPPRSKVDCERLNPEKSYHMRELSTLKSNGFCYWIDGTLEAPGGLPYCW